ncbi:MAG TPA: amidohydrolase family protein [Fimbriiglobus sp.]|jgi:imidazolonepropionase-like amidohydrolase
MSRTGSLLIGVLLAWPVAAADPPAVMFKNATIYTATADAPIENGILVVMNGKISVVAGEKGPNSIALPAGTETIDLKGAVIIPGLVDTHSHIGIFGKPAVKAHADGNEMSGPVQSGIRAIDAINPQDPGIRMATAGGVTTANIMPGSGNVIGGQTLYVKLRGKSIEDMRIIGRLANGTEVLGGLKMANGENPKGYGRTKQQAPFTRMKVAALQREQFVKAREYMQKKDAPRDLSLEPLVEVLQGKRTVHFHSHRADDLLTAVRIAEEFQFELVLHHATEGYRIADILAKKKIPVSLTLVDSPGGKAEVMGLLEENAAILEKAGVVVAINTDDYITESRFLLRTGSLAVRGGMSDMAALKALTATPAKLLHLDHRLGTLEAGKDADFVILSGKPFSIYTKVQQTWIDGKKVFDAADPKDRPYRDGGFALPAGEAVPMTKAELPLERVALKTAIHPTDLLAAKQLYIFADYIFAGTGKTFTNGLVVVEDGKIVSVEGNVRERHWPANVAAVKVESVTPGLIDPHCSAGLSGAWNTPADQDQDETSDPNQADLRVIDGYNPHEPMLEFLRANGVTVIHAAPGRAAVIAGQSGVFRTKGRTIEEATLKFPAGILVNLGEVPKTTFAAKGPMTRMAVASVVRRAFEEAQMAHAKKDAAGLSPKVTALFAALDGKVPVYFAAHRADDILTGLRIADEFKLKPVITLGTEGYRIVDELARRKVPVVVHPTFQRAGGSMETLNTVLGNAGALHAKGVPVTIGTMFEGYVPKQRNLRSEAALAAVNGLGRDKALAAITLDAAKLLGIDKDYGSIEVGKVADLVLYDGDPFENATHITHTIMSGRVVYDRAEYLKLPFDRRIMPFITGGSGLGCCMGN